jgi:hypothetical protein
LLHAAARDARRLEREGLVWSSLLAELVLAGAAGLGGRSVLAATHLETTLRYPGQLGLHEAVARLRAARISGDRAAAEAARSWMTEQGVADPERMARLLAPGL